MMQILVYRKRKGKKRHLKSREDETEDDVEEGD
jgi:hypothetical protein